MYPLALHTLAVCAPVLKEKIPPMVPSGIAGRLGKWATWEEDLLRKNVEKYRAANNIQNIEEYILSSR